MAATMHALDGTIANVALSIQGSLSATRTVVITSSWRPPSTPRRLLRASASHAQPAWSASISMLCGAAQSLDQSCCSALRFRRPLVPVAGHHDGHLSRGAGSSDVGTMLAPSPDRLGGWLTDNSPGAGYSTSTCRWHSAHWGSSRWCATASTTAALRCWASAAGRRRSFSSCSIALTCLLVRLGRDHRRGGRRGLRCS
jgi:hypothetical protein